MTRIQPIPKGARTASDALLGAAGPVGGTVFAADVYLEGAEAWTEVPGGLAHPGRPIVNVDHLDCDSVLAAGLLSGRLEPDPRDDAAVEAFFDALAGCEDGGEAGLDPFAREALGVRHERRARAVELVREGRCPRVRGPLPRALQNG